MSEEKATKPTEGASANMTTDGAASSEVDVTKRDSDGVDRTSGIMPAPDSLIMKDGGDTAAAAEPLPQVDQLGTISLETLNEYHCDNKDRRCLALFGVVYDVTAAVNKYAGPDGAYKEFAGHDITLALGSGHMDPRWLDKFIKMKDNWKDGAEKWIDFYASKYPTCGMLQIYEDEDPNTWPEPTPEETEELDKQACIIL